MFKEKRTLDDLLIMEPGGRYRCNILDYERSKGAGHAAVNQALMTFGETLDRIGGSGNDHDPFWKNQNRRMLHNAVEVIVGTTGKLDPVGLAEIHCRQHHQPDRSGERRVAERNSTTRRWRPPKNNAQSPEQTHDREMARQYWLEEVPTLNDRTRSSIYVQAC